MESNFKNRFEAQTIDFYDFASKAVKTAMQFEGRTYTGLSLSPDGESVLYVRGEPPESDIMLVEGFR